MQPHELESARRSLAMSASLPSDVVLDLIDTCDALMRRHREIERILRELHPAWGGTRRALNELQKVLTTPSPDRRRSAPRPS